MDIGSIFNDITKWIGILKNAADKGTPVATDLVNNVGGAVTQLIEIGKDLFEGKKPTPEQLAAAQKLNEDLNEAIRNS